ncbi:MAG: DUF4124 domain-containing protein [Gammaproteobacteria bacterium]
MKRLIVFLLVFVCASANAQIFKRIGPDGQVYFSDQPGPGAERVELPPMQSISLPPVTGETESTEPASDMTTEQQQEAAAFYTGFSITSPIDQRGIRANDGNITVQLSVQPELRPGDMIVLNVDGEDGEATRSSIDMTVELTNLSRGQHTVRATLVDKKGNELIQSDPVTFFVMRVAGG